MRTALVSIALLYLRGRLLGEPNLITAVLIALAWVGLVWAILQDIKEAFK